MPNGCGIITAICYNHLDDLMKPGNREKFLKIYANLPLGVRQEIILVLDDGRTITWDVAFFEIENNTELSKVILEKLEKIQLI